MLITRWFKVDPQWNDNFFKDEKDNWEGGNMRKNRCEIPEAWRLAKILDPSEDRGRGRLRRGNAQLCLTREDSATIQYYFRSKGTRSGFRPKTALCLSLVTSQRPLFSHSYSMSLSLSLSLSLPLSLTLCPDKLIIIRESGPGRSISLSA